MNRVFREDKTSGKAILIRHTKEIDSCDALIIPGGESTTISRILVRTGMYNAIRRRMENNDIALMGTCAGCVLLAKELTDTADVKLLEAIDMQVERNAFGRQKESHERSLRIKGFAEPYHAVFIRAPIITKTWGDCEILAKAGKEIVMARQKNYLALSFHPELTGDLRIHRFFLKIL